VVRVPLHCLARIDRMQHFQPKSVRGGHHIKYLAFAVLLHSGNATHEALLCNFDQGLCNFTGPVANSWTWRSGSTPSSPTGPSSDHTSGVGCYMYVEASSPNFPYKGPFELETSLGSDGVSSVFFWYNMYGQSMGSLVLQTYSNVSGWEEHWSKSGDQGEEWQMATVAIGSTETSIVKFVAYTGWDYTGDLAIDDVNITIRTTPAPSITPAPSNTPSPTLVPSLVPTYAPTTLLASTSLQFQHALQASGNIVSVGADIVLSTALVVSNVAGVRIFGNDFEINGGDITRCISVIEAEIWITNLVISNGFSWGSAGGMFINGYSQVTLQGCSFFQNKAYESSAGALYVDGYEGSDTSDAQSAKYISVILHNCTFAKNSGAFGGAIRFNFQARDSMHCIPS